MISDGAAEAIKEDDAMSVFFMDFDMAPSVIWARDLYDQMQIRSDFRKWFPRMCQYGFVEGRDYEFVPRVRPQDEGGRTVQRYVKDYRITLEMAKQLYKLHHFHKNDCFRSCEGQHCMGTDHWMQAVIELLHQHKCKSHAPPKRFYESQPPDSLVTTTQIAKEYGCGAKVFNRLLHLHGIQYRANNQWVLYKSKKNNNDRTQYRQKNHHEAIVSREVFNAANHLRASRNYSKKNRPLPVLSVVEDGILRGYVPFDKDWTGFSAEEYREASESVMKEPDVTVTADVKKRLDLTGYEIVRVQYFSTMQNPAMTISNGRLRFNTACLKKFENVEYVELLLNSVERCIAIRPCDKNNPNAIRWGRLKEGRWCASTLGCRGLAKTLFDIMEWDEDLRYRFRGQFLEQGDNKMMLFAFDEPEMIKVEEIVLPPKENTEEDEGETVKKKIYIFPPEWAGTFGQPITSIAQVGILRQEHYAGNWDVFRPATEIEEMNIFTAESLNELLREAEKIMEGWTDYR